MNTIESIRKACGEKDWNGYDAEPIPEEVLKNAEIVAKFLTFDSGWEMFPQADGTVTFEFSGPAENPNHLVDYTVYPDHAEIIKYNLDLSTNLVIEYTIDDFLKYLKNKKKEERKQKIEEL